MKNNFIKLLVGCCCVVTLVGCGTKAVTQNNSSDSKQEVTQNQQETDQNNKDEEAKKNTNKKEDASNKTDKKEEVNSENQSEKKKQEGKITEKKDFMFVVEDSAKKPYSFAFEKKPQGYDDLKVGDNVTIEYTGDLSETEAFKGEVISVTKSVDK